MSAIKFVWLGLNSDREKVVFLEGFWEGVAATQRIQEEVKELERKFNRPKETIQRTSDKV